MSTTEKTAAVPQELRECPQWVCWAKEERNGEITKIPYSPRGGMAKTSDPETWGSFEQAAKYAGDYGMAGVGFVFSSEDPFTGIDLDKCRDPESGELEEWAREIIEEIGSYAECSPSGTGVHVILRGKLPPGRRGFGDGHGFYDERRFFTVTGELLESSPEGIFERQAELEGLHRRLFPPEENGEGGSTTNGNISAAGPSLSDEELVWRAKSAENGGEFARLWAGEISGYTSHSEADLALCSRLAFYTGPDPERIGALLEQSGLYRDKWERKDYRERTISKALAGRTEFYQGRTSAPPASKTQTNGHGHSTDGHREEDTGGGGDRNLTDVGNADRFIADHGPDVLWCENFGYWLVWDGQRWVRDWTRELWRMAERTVRGIYEEARHAPDRESSREIAKHAMRSQSATRIREMIELAKSKAAITPEDLDSNPYLLNVANGTVDLRSGELRAHRREDRITRISPVEYDPQAGAPVFEAFMEQILPSKDVREFVQKAAGYSTTGDVSEQCMFINYGTGANGKSTFQEVLSAALGDYAMSTPTETLLAKPAGDIPNDVARLKGAHCVLASEPEEGRRLDESLVKKLTGGDTITARFMRAEYFDFEPTHKIWLSTNHRPPSRDTSHAFWRRIRLIPFTVTIPEEDQDRHLSEKLDAELPGILAWIVAGCLSWQHEGLEPPEEVTAATQEYREEMDVLASFIADCCTVHEHASAQAQQLYNAYRQWCEDNGERPLSGKRFSQQLTERGFEREKNGRVIYRGIGLLYEGGDDPGGPRGEEPPAPKGSGRGEASSSEPSSPSGNASGGGSAVQPPTPDLEEPESTTAEGEGSTDADPTPELVAKVEDALNSDPELAKLAVRCMAGEITASPLISRTAFHFYGTSQRWREVKPAVERWLSRQVSEGEEEKQ